MRPIPTSRHLHPEALRYYYAFKLGPGTEDIDLNLDDFVARINSDLVGKFVNIASRCAGFVGRQFGGRLADQLENPALHRDFAAAAEEIAALYEGREYGRAMREIMRLADRANQYIDERKPWALARDPARAAEVQAVCTDGINLFRVLLLYLKPVLPAMAARAEVFLGAGPLSWTDAGRPLLGRTIGTYEPLITRVDPAAVARMVEAVEAGGSGRREQGERDGSRRPDRHDDRPRHVPEERPAHRYGARRPRRSRAPTSSCA